MAGVQISDEMPSGPQVTAADFEYPVGGLEAMLYQVIRLHLAELDPLFMASAADGGIEILCCLVPHHRTVVVYMTVRIGP
jgi:hypothetical protein